MTERQTLQQMQQQANGTATDNGLTCPKCGCGHLGDSYGTNKLPGGTVHRYRQCRNPSCQAKYLVRQPAQPPEEIVREIAPRKDVSDVGNVTLKVHRQTA